jgi:acetolactate synthase-1/2/3 large subunit
VAGAESLRRSARRAYSLPREREGGELSEPATTVAAHLAATIAADAAGPVFAFPGGGSNLDVIEELGKRGVEVVVAHSEGGAAFMAATSGDLSGRPAVLLVGLGPGVANAVNGVAHAWLDQSPLLVVSDRFADDELDTSGHQVLDHAALLAPVTKWQVTLTPANARTAVQRAFAEAMTSPRGPVHIELPRDVAAAAVSDAPAAEQAGVAATLEIPAAVAAALTAARQPLLLVGDEAAHVPQQTLVALAEQLRAPVLTSYKGKGVFPERHPLWCGIVTNAALEADVLRDADAIVAIGLDPVELLPRPWTVSPPLLSLRAHGEAAPGYSAGCELIGDVPTLVQALLAALGDCASSVTEEDAAASRDRMLSRLRIPGPFTAVEAVEAALGAAPESTTVTVDAGAHMFAATWFWRSTLPQRFLISNGLATMGYAIPAAVAASLARPGEPVLAFTGDGGFLLHGAELETAVRLGAKIVVIALNDSSLSLIRIKQEDKRYRRAAVDFNRVGLAAVGEALGAAGATVDDADGLRDAVTAALAADGPSVIEVLLAGSEYRALQHAIRGGG